MHCANSKPSVRKEVLPGAVTPAGGGARVIGNTPFSTFNF